jgi:hypothetical protein
MKLISLSLWGSNQAYLQGALRNAELAAVHYPDWTCRFYCANDLERATVEALQDRANCEVVLMAPVPDRLGAFWRFFPSKTPR